MDLRHYFCLLTPSRPDLHQTVTPEEREIFIAHCDYLRGLYEQGIVLQAGTSFEDGEDGFAITILTAQDKAEALALIGADPAVAQGLLNARVTEYDIFLDRGDEEDGWPRAGDDAASPAAPTAIRHVELLVEDTARSRAFYEEVLGFETLSVEGRCVWMRLGDRELLLRPRDGGPESPYDLVLWSDDPRATLARLSEQGLSVRGNSFADLDGNWFQLVGPDGTTTVP